MKNIALILVVLIFASVFSFFVFSTRECFTMTDLINESCNLGDCTGKDFCNFFGIKM
jgi:hypothetical protein